MRVHPLFDMLTQEDQILAALRRIIRAVDLHSRSLLDECGMTGPQLAVLRAANRLGAASATALARDVHLSTATVTGILDRLERRGLILRERDGQDRRAVTVTMTDRGGVMLAVAPSLLQDEFRRKLSSLEEWERSQILATLQRIAAMMSATDLDASPILTSDPLSPAGADNGTAKDRGAPSEPSSKP